MPSLLTSAQLCEHALRQIGVFSVYDTGADPASFQVTIERLDLLVAEMVGSYNFWYFTPAEQTIALEAGVNEYELGALLDDDLQFVQHIFLLRNGKQWPVRQIRKSTYDEFSEDPPTGTTPEWAYIERKDNPKLFLLPAPIEGDMLLVNGQQYSDDLTQDNGQIPHGFPAAWQRSIILQLAADIGAGPVKKIPRDELEDLKKDAGKAMRRLDAFNNRENVRRPRYTKPRDF